MDIFGNILNSLRYSQTCVERHKIIPQGSTYNHVFIDLNDMLYDSNGKLYTNYDDVLRRIYVGCSRARTSLTICYGY